MLHGDEDTLKADIKKTGKKWQDHLPDKNQQVELAMKYHDQFMIMIPIWYIKKKKSQKALNKKSSSLSGIRTPRILVIFLMIPISMKKKKEITPKITHLNFFFPVFINCLCTKID